MPAVTLSVIIVNWNVRELLRACLLSVQRAGRALALEIIVVDNASADGSAEMVRRAFPAVRLIACDTNAGFSAGQNIGLAAATGAYLLCLNPDTEIVGDALRVMLDTMQAHSDVGVAGPRLCYGDGSVQSSRRRFPTFATALLESTVVQQWFPRNRVLDRYYVADRPDDAEQDVDWLNGACLLVRRAVYAQVGGFDEGFFMYSEELDWQKRIKDAGWRIVYLPQAEVIHYEGKSSEQVVPLRHIRFQRSKIRYFRKHHGRFQAVCLRIFLLLTYVWQLLAEGAKWLVGHKRPLRRERVAAYWQVFLALAR
ncbi:MAG: glycosyltransferase family 2 protein [Chloroflexi bacterium]|nr:glycosyltransferase family 2 protein [Chloroflexota bacterium]